MPRLLRVIAIPPAHFWRRSPHTGPADVTRSSSSAASSPTSPPSRSALGIRQRSARRAKEAQLLCCNCVLAVDETHQLFSLLNHPHLGSRRGSHFPTPTVRALRKFVLRYSQLSIASKSGIQCFSLSVRQMSGPYPEQAARQRERSPGVGASGDCVMHTCFSRW